MSHWLTGLARVPRSSPIRDRAVTICHTVPAIIEPPLCSLRIEWMEPRQYPHERPDRLEAKQGQAMIGTEVQMTRRLPSGRAPLLLTLSLLAPSSLHAQAGFDPPLLNTPVDVSPSFQDFTSTYFVADNLSEFDPVTGEGKVTWKRHRLATRHAFNNTLAHLQPVENNEFPDIEYEADPYLPFSLDFVSPRTVRVRMKTGLPARDEGLSPMLVREPPRDTSWKMEKVSGGYRYANAHGSVTIIEKPWHLEFHDSNGRLLTRTHHLVDNETTLWPALPFSFVRRASDYARRMGPVFSLAPGEKIFGAGESFTRLDKRGQRVVLFVDDPNGAESEEMYKPIPFFMSSRGYGMFVHTSAPATFDFGRTFSGTTALMLGDDQLDLFVFLGQPKEILDEYTELTGKATMPPLWSFGFWMSRITYFSEEQVREVASKLREHRIPSDVIHLDTGWFETDWRCDYQFSKTRFEDPAKMIADLRDDGFHISLWQLPYFTPQNTLFAEIVGKQLAVRDPRGNLPYEDAVLDFTNPAAVEWYQEKIAGLLRMGVGAIKVDFGEAAPMNGQYASGRTGWYEHNLYPLLYNRTVAEVTREVTGETIIWARSTWAGSQRYPLHWGGDAANSDTGMAATLRGGLSLGLSGFTFWSHDIGGFTARTPEELYRRWLPFGMLTSHTRSHGAPPKEPWEYGPDFTDAFRRAAELRYRLMPYLYAQAKDSSERGLPMLRALFVEYPEDPGSWLVEDQYLLGTDILVAPLMEEGTTRRDVYLPPGEWIDYQSGESYAGGWHAIEAGEIPVVMLVRGGAAIPHIELAQSTQEMDWSTLQLVVFGAESEPARGLVSLPAEGTLHEVLLHGDEGDLTIEDTPLATRVNLTARSFPAGSG
jgi:alpha-D-xyloside xylohydrolase